MIFIMVKAQCTGKNKLIKEQTHCTIKAIVFYIGTVHMVIKRERRVLFLISCRVALPRLKEECLTVPSIQITQSCGLDEMNCSFRKKKDALFALCWYLVDLHVWLIYEDCRGNCQHKQEQSRRPGLNEDVGPSPAFHQRENGTAGWKSDMIAATQLWLGL